MDYHISLTSGRKHFKSLQKAITAAKMDLADCALTINPREVSQSRIISWRQFGQKDGTRVVPLFNMVHIVIGPHPKTGRFTHQEFIHSTEYTNTQEK